MSVSSGKLADALQLLRDLQLQHKIAVQSADLARVHRERLIRHGFLQEVMKGWYIPTRPDEPIGETTAWYTSFWDFITSYLNHRFKASWSLSPEQSLLIHAGHTRVPDQLIIRAEKASNNVTQLLHDTSLLEVKAALPDKHHRVEQKGLRLFSLASALIATSPVFFSKYPIEAHAALTQLKDASDVLGLLLQGNHSVIAGRLAAALRYIGRDSVADEIVATMRAADYIIQEQNPFTEALPKLNATRITSPYAVRIELMWYKMRDHIVPLLPKPSKVNNIKSYLARVDDLYIRDAYHSLSIEGYRVGPELIERVRSGGWNPDEHQADSQQRDALAARGYWQAFQEVRKSVERILQGENPGRVVQEDHRIWYRQMFAPSIAAGLIKPEDLAGYRSGPVYIRRSKHVPPNSDAVRDSLPVFFDLLAKEKNPNIAMVLGHFIFVYIHPYMDGNGRIGRFLMNVMMAAAGHPWTIIPLERRKQYMEALEVASVQQDIRPFAKELAWIMKHQRQ